MEITIISHPITITKYYKQLLYIYITKQTQWNIMKVKVQVKVWKLAIAPLT